MNTLKKMRRLLRVITPEKLLRSPLVLALLVEFDVFILLASVGIYKWGPLLIGMVIVLSALGAGCLMAAWLLATILDDATLERLDDDK